MEMGDKLPICKDDEVDLQRSRSSCPDNQHYQSSTGFTYEELMGGSVPCPSCNGSGRIPKEHERQLIALIPFSDKRLKPRRTTLWVLIAVVCSVIVCGLCTFFLIPRSIILTSSEDEIYPYYSYINDSSTMPLVRLSFINYVDITNFNFININVINSTMKTISLIDSGREISQSVNSTEIMVPLRSKRMLQFNTTIDFTEKFMPEYCEYIKAIFVQLDIVITSRYLGHDEQTSVSTKRNIGCFIKK